MYRANYSHEISSLMYSENNKSFKIIVAFMFGVLKINYRYMWSALALVSSGVTRYEFSHCKRNNVENKFIL